MASLESFLPNLGTQDTKKKLQIGQQLIDYLRNEENSIDCDAPNVFIDSILAWLHNSNFKVAQNGLEVLALLATRMREDFKPYQTSTISLTIDRLGDPKDAVREAAKALLTRLMNYVSTPQNILEKLIPAFTHKIWRVREEVCMFLQDCLLRYGVVGPTNGQLLVSKFVPCLVNSLSDQTPQVRDASMVTLLSVYKHVGERLRQEIIKKHSNMPQQKLQTLLSKFDEIATTGEVTSGMASLAINGTGGGNGFAKPSLAAKARQDDEVDFKRTPAASSLASKRATSAPPVKRREKLAANNPAPALPTSCSKPQAASNPAAQAGAADEEMFMNSFEAVERVQIFSGKNVEEEMKKIAEVLSNPNNDWEERVRKLRLFRSLIISGATNLDEFFVQLKFLDVAFQTSVKDLRSQVVREACISIAYLSQSIGNRCDRFVEMLVPKLIDQIQNSAKIMSSSAVVAIRFIISYTHAPKLIPIITYHFSSRSKEIRRACCEFLALLLQTWPASLLERHVGAIQEAIKKGVSDADSDARCFARKAFGGFADKFRAEADYLLASLDSNKQRMLAGEAAMSTRGSSNSLNKMPSLGYTNVRPAPVRLNSASSSTNGSMESVNRGFPLAYKKSAIPVCSPVVDSLGGSPLRPTTSAIDVSAQRRAKDKANNYLMSGEQHQHYQQHQQTPPRSVYTLSRPTTLRSQRRAFDTVSNDERSPRRSRVVSKSQPGSRSQSPSSRLAYYSAISTSTSTAAASNVGTNVQRTPNVTPRARRTSMTSRDASPARSTTTPSSGAYQRRVSSSSLAARSSLAGRTRSNRVSVSSENLLNTAFVMHAIPRRKTYDGESDDASETSSICSDYSFGGYDMARVEDVSRILDLLSSQQWSDRNNGLKALAHFMNAGDRHLNAYELKRVTDIFTKMLVDPHTKAFSLFLTILNELIQNYKHELSSWLYILMTRLFLKVGSDTLGSVQTRILKTLELIRESFSIGSQFDVIMRLLSDPSQTLNPKVKIAILQYLSKLIFLMDSIDFVYGRENSYQIQTALMKIVPWTADIKSIELRRLAQDTIVDLYNLNSVEMLQFINGLPKTYQDAAQQIIQQKRKTRSPMAGGSASMSAAAGMMQTPFKVKSLYAMGSNNMNNGTSPSAVTPSNVVALNGSRFQSHHIAANGGVSGRATTSDLHTTWGGNHFFNDSPPLNPAEIYDSLKKTSDEIQKYSFSASFDSGISQIDGSKQLQQLNQAQTLNNQNNGDEGTLLSTTVITNGHSVAKNCETTMNESLNLDRTLDNVSFSVNSLSDAIYYVQRSTPDEVATSAARLYVRLLAHYEQNAANSNKATKLVILRLIGQLLLKHVFEAEVERTLRLLVLVASHDGDKDVMKTAEETAQVAGQVFDALTTFNIIKEWIVSQDCATSIAAIKILKRMAEVKDSQTMLELLPQMMPALLQAFDSDESAVRKATVFCIVALYSCVGEVLYEHLKPLNISKMKLVSLYINRSKQSVTDASGQ